MFMGCPGLTPGFPKGVKRGMMAEEGHNCLRSWLRDFFVFSGFGRIY